MEIIAGDLSDPRVVALLQVHLDGARGASPPCSAHALDVAGLQGPGIDLWAAWEGKTLLGFGALLEIAADHGEIKSMHVAEEARAHGVGAAMLAHIVSVARGRGYRRLSLETGSMPYFAPARALYARCGFVECGPLGGYGVDPNTVFLTRALF